MDGPFFFYYDRKAVIEDNNDRKSWLIGLAVDRFT